jgi:integral membrane sensor domain MASE1
MKGTSPGRANGRDLMALLLVAGAYAVAGRLGVLVAIPPGYATPIWLSSGLAWAWILVWGPWVWPGIWLGSTLVHVWTTFDASTATATLTSLAIPTSIGVGAAGQALIGAYLVRRLVGFPRVLTRARDIITCVVLAGPLSGLISATWAVTTLFVGGVLPPAICLFNWWTWWIGETMGVLIMTPLVFGATAAPGLGWHQRRLTMTVPLGLALVLVVVGLVQVRVQEQATTQFLFERRTSARADALRRSLDGYLEVLHVLRDFYTSTPVVERRTFHTLVERPLTRYPGLQALAWVPRVPEAQRATAEAVARREGYPDFQITEQAAQGQRMPSGPRLEHFPIAYVEPYAGNEAALGFDLASAPIFPWQLPGYV